MHRGASARAREEPAPPDLRVAHQELHQSARRHGVYPPRASRSGACAHPAQSTHGRRTGPGRRMTMATKPAAKAAAKAAPKAAPKAKAAPAPAPSRAGATKERHGFRRKLVGTVTSDKMDKTVVVEVVRQLLHNKYKK